MSKKITFNDQPYSNENNFHCVRHGETLHVELTYPDLEQAGMKYVVFDQESVRASDGIRLSYDYGRDGYVVEQPKPKFVTKRIPDGSCFEEQIDEWVEVGFFRAWALVRRCP